VIVNEIHWSWESICVRPDFSTFLWGKVRRLQQRKPCYLPWQSSGKWCDVVSCPVIKRASEYQCLRYFTSGLFISLKASDPLEITSAGPSPADNADIIAAIIIISAFLARACLSWGLYLQGRNICINSPSKPLFILGRDGVRRYHTAHF